MSTGPVLRFCCLCLLAAFAASAWALQYKWDPGCKCWVPDTSGPENSDTGPGSSTPPDPEPSRFVLSSTGVDSESHRLLSPVVSFDHHQPDGVVETREFQYSTPRNFANRAGNSVNLWLVFHGGNGSSSTMHRYFKQIPHTAPTVVVYPEALRVTHNNVVTTDANATVMWRGLKTPGQGADPNAYRDIAFVERLIARLLINNPQLNGNKVYVSGFSSGGSMVWTLLCYRSSLFAGFAIYSRQLGLMRETGGCGDGQLSGSGNHRTGYELLTGSQPDRYGRHDLVSFPTKPVLYIHGTEDDNLDWPGEPGCWKGGPPVDSDDCTLAEDPLYSMAYGGPLEQRDDVSSVNWLLNRHQLAPDPVSDCTVLDADPGNNDSDADLSNTDKVTTHRYEYAARTSSSGLVVAHQQPVTWYEMQGAGHDVSTLNQVAGNSNSTDFEASLHTKTFFEDHAGMLSGPQTSTTTAAFLCTWAPW